MFLSLFKASGIDRSPYGDFWFEPIAGRTSSGMRVSADQALRLSAVWACVRILSETLASMPFCMYRPKPNGGKEMVTDHPIVRLFNVSPNPYQTPFEWREMLQAHLALRGNAYNQIVTDGRGTIQQLLPIHPDLVKIERLAGSDYRYRVKQRDGTDLILTRGEMWHLRGLSFDGVLGLNPIEMARDAVGMGLSAQEYGARFFANDARPGGVIEFKGSFKDKSARDTFIQSWQAAQSGASRGKTAVLEHDMSYKEIGLNNADAQFLEVRKFQVTEIARLFRVPPHMVADLDRATFSNIEHQSLEFVLHTMTPWAERWESSIESALLLETEEDLEIEFDFTSLLRGDHAARAAYYNSGIMTGWLTRNEARLMEGYDPKAGLDMPLQPLNMVPAGSMPQDPSTPKPGNPALPGPVEDASSRQDSRHLALVRAVAERVARKELQVVRAACLQGNPEGAVDLAYQVHAGFVASCMHVSLETAKSYCAERLSEHDGHQTSDQFMAVALSKLERLALTGKLE